MTWSRPTTSTARSACGSSTTGGRALPPAHRLTGANGLNQYQDYDYDPRGNLTGDGSFAYAYDATDRLVSAEAHGHSARVEFGYDGQGRRTVKRSFTWTGSSWALSKTLKFAYDGWDLLAEFEVQADGSESLVRSYAWGMGMGGGIGGLLSVTDHAGTAPKTYLPLYDGTGNVIGLADADTGAVVATYTYSAFGELLSATGPAAGVNPFRFSTKYHDEATGLAYFGYRYYSPEQGRWINRDPSG